MGQVHRRSVKGEQRPVQAVAVVACMSDRENNG